jgi:hypothetical protein
MREIEIDTEVFAKIWSHRLGGEESENEILRRLLVAERRDRVQRMQAEPATAGIAQVGGGADAAVRGGRAKWRDDVRRALEELGGNAALADIYDRVRSIRRRAGRSLPISTEAVIRRELENNSSDSESWTRERDWFAMPHGKGAGYWALKSDINC